MKRWLIGGVVLALAVAAGVLLTRAPHQWSVLLVVAEPPAQTLPAPQGRAPSPRLRRLAGAGVRLPLAPQERDIGSWLMEVLGGPPPARSLLGTWQQRGWPRVGATELPLPGPLTERFDRLDEAPRGGVDGALTALDAQDVRPSQSSLVVVVLRPSSPEEWDRSLGRLLDGVASRVTLSRTLVVVVDRAQRSALLVAPERPSDLEVRGGLSPADLGHELARWLRL